MAKQILFPAGMIKKFPRLYSQDGKQPADVKIVCKIFNPYGIGTWYLTEYCPEQQNFFGLCCLQEAELGYVSRQELEDVRVLGGLPLERDLYWTGTLADAMSQEKGRGR